MYVCFWYEWIAECAGGWCNTDEGDPSVFLEKMLNALETSKQGCFPQVMELSDRVKDTFSGRR